MMNAITTTSMNVRTTAATTRPITRPDGPVGSGGVGGAADSSGGVVEIVSCKICLAINAMSGILPSISIIS